MRIEITPKVVIAASVATITLVLYACAGATNSVLSHVASTSGNSTQSQEATSLGQAPASTGVMLAVSTGPYHIATAAYDDTGGEGQNASATQVNQLVTYALNEGSDKPVSDCHSGAHACKAVYYIRPYDIVDPATSSCREQPDADVSAAAVENWFVHDAGYTDAAHRVWGKNKWGCTMWSMNGAVPGVRAWWNHHLQTEANSYDLYFVDMSPMNLTHATWFFSGGGCRPWPAKCVTTQELPTDTAVVNAHVDFMDALNHLNGTPMRFIYQQAYAPTTQASDLTAIASTTRIASVSCEGCIANIASTVMPANYESYLNEMAAINATGAAFYIISDGTASAGSATQVLQRLVTIGVAWLAYSEGHTIVHANLESNTNGLAVWPEDLIYPSHPLQTMRLGASDIQVASGVWRREFTTCYQKGVFFGRCAAIVNASGSSVVVKGSWFSQTYKHVVSLSGGDVLSGGVANVAAIGFVANGTKVQAGGALLLAQ